jgi:large subunit ribosomal protein L1
VEYRVDKNGVVHAPCGKVSFGDITENILALAESIIRLPAARGRGQVRPLGDDFLR